jgi:hypothetical protein
MRKNIYSEEKPVYVNSDVIRSIGNFISNNWAFFLSSIIIPVFVWWWSARRKKAAHAN